MRHRAVLLNSEIARALVISEKTVSTHISHLLANTGTENRVELARLVHRLADERDRTGQSVRRSSSCAP